MHYNLIASLFSFQWLTCSKHALSTSVKDLHITHIVNATNRCIPNAYEHEGVIYLNVDIDDDESTSITPYFKLMQEFLNQAVASAADPSSVRCLVHCMIGQSRSATLVIAYLMTREPFPTLRASFNQVKTARNIIAPNPLFAKDLLRFELVCKPDLTENTIKEEEMVNPNYRKCQKKFSDARRALDDLSDSSGGGSRSESGCMIS